jgi:diadenosine tetraphosphate (Ap4A) HIT family hydrolase
MVITRKTAASRSDPFQSAWQDPKKAHAIYVDDQQGLMVLPDAQPVVPNHVLIITREAKPYEELSTKRKHQVLELANLTAEHIRNVLQPKRKIGFCIWGNTIRTTHIHLLPRNVPEDGVAFFIGERPWASADQLEDTRKMLQFPIKLRKEARRRLDDVASKFVDS